MLIQYPSNADYELAIKSGDNLYKSISGLVIHPSRTKPIKYYTYGSGSYAVVFKGSLNQNKVAVRFFLQSSPDIAVRYQKISAYLINKNLSWYNKVSWFNDEIIVNNKSYPMVLMNWQKEYPLMTILKII